MTIAAHPVGNLSAAAVETMLAAAGAAPSLHNSQPWRFHRTPTAIELYADTDRALPVADPDHRELVLACGGALLNLRLALHAAGLHPTVTLLPEPAASGLLARVRPVGHRPVTPTDRALADAIPRRHTNRRPFLPTPVPLTLLAGLRKAARVEQAWLATVTPAQLPLLRALVAAAHDTQQQDPGFRAEWDQWTGRTAHSPDGVPARNSGPLPESHDQWVLRDFSGGVAKPRLPGKDFEPEPLIAVIGTFHDGTLARLQAGQAMQRVLLTATTSGLAASFLSQVVEVPATRRQLRDLIGGGLWPQALLRIGYGTPVPATPRRPVRDLLD